jgi:DNA-binding transcriptional LysR family regulator
MDTHRIRYFLSLARTGSMSRAAELHHISPPAFSKAMKVFEGEVGQKLFVHSGRGVLLTDRARALVPELAEVVARLDAIQEAARDPKGMAARPGRKRIGIATFEVFSTHFFERAADGPLAEYDCDIHELTPGKMEAAVAAGLADLGITYIPIPHPDLDHIRVAPIEMGVFGGGSKAIPALKTAADCRKLPFAVPVAPVEGAPNKVHGLDGWPDDAFPRQVRYRVQMLETALGLCRRGLAYAYIPKFIARLHNELVRPAFALHEVRLPARVSRQKDYVYLIKRKSDVEGAPAKKVAAALRRYCVHA